jgi:hypothetical protein
MVLVDGENGGVEPPHLPGFERCRAARIANVPLPQTRFAGGRRSACRTIFFRKMPARCYQVR